VERRGEKVEIKNHCHVEENRGSNLIELPLQVAHLPQVDLWRVIHFHPAEFHLHLVELYQHSHLHQPHDPPVRYLCVPFVYQSGSIHSWVLLG
jgi:hypothetical protein